MISREIMVELYIPKLDFDICIRWQWVWIPTVEETHSYDNYYSLEINWLCVAIDQSYHKK